MPIPSVLSYDQRHLDLSMFNGNDWLDAPRRGFGTSDIPITAQVVVDEDGSDDLMITEHPVQQGSVIADHAFKRPCEVRIRMGWSDAWAFDNGANGVTWIYGEILRLQASRVPFSVYTGKRQYDNMLVASLRTHTDQKLEWTLMCDVEFREIILVGTASVTGASYASGTLANPQANTPQLEAGESQPMPASLAQDAATTAALAADSLNAWQSMLGYGPGYY
jgi:hypothetical protein